MAELSKYQQTGRVFADLPQFDFANVREAFKSSQGLANSLDRLTGFANKFAAQAVEEQAEKWAVKNGYSYEQILEAQKQGITPDDLIASSGGGIVWQNTVRKIQGEQLRVEIEGLSRQELAKVQAAVETRQLTDDEEIAQKIDAIGKGLFAPLQTISPDAYVKGRNAYGLHAASVYSEAKKQVVADIKTAAAVKADGNYTAIMELNKATIPNLNDIESINAAKDLNAQRVYEAYAESGNTALGRQMAEKSRVEFDNQFTNYFVKFTLNESFDKDPKALEKITMGDFGDASANAKFSVLDYDVQEKIISESIKRRANRLDSIDKTKKLNLINLEEKNKQNWKLVFDPNSTISKQEKDLLISEMFDSGYITKDEVKTYYKGDTAEDGGDPILVGSIKRQIWQGLIKTEEQVKILSAGKLTPKQIGPLISLVGQRDFSAVSSGIRSIVNDNSKAWEEPKYDTGNELADEVVTIITADPTKTGEQALREANEKRQAGEKYQRAINRQKQYHEKYNTKYPDFNWDKESAENYVKRKGINADSRDGKNLIDDYADYIKQRNITHVDWVNISGAKK